MNRKLAIAIAAATLVVLGGAAYLLWFRGGDGEQAQAGQASAAPPSPATSTAPANQAHDVAAALRGLATDPGSLVASSSREQVGDDASKGVPPGSTVVPDEASWAPDGAGGGVIAVSVRPPGLPESTFAAVVVLKSGHWKVAATMPLPDQASTSAGPTR